MLDLKTMKWIEIENSGIPKGYTYHSLSPVSPSQLLLVGGKAGFPDISNRVAMFDVIGSKWEEEAPLPTQFSGYDSGRSFALEEQQAFVTRNETTVSVICIGGAFFRNIHERVHPEHMIVFDFSIENYGTVVPR